LLPRGRFAAEVTAVSDDVSKADVERELDEALADHDRVTVDVEQILMTGPGSEFPGEEGGLNVTVEGNVGTPYDDVEAAADVAAEAIADLDLNPQRKREAKTWAPKDGPVTPRVEFGTDSL
jgi:hypothetical protein